MKDHPVVTDYDKLAASTPLNRQAAVVRDGAGEQYQPNVNLRSHEHWDTPPETRPVPQNAPSQIGKRFGRFVVVGYIGSHPKKAAKWLVRCACGRYESRHSKAINNPGNTRDCCQECGHLINIKRNERFVRTGRHVSREDVV